MNKSLVNNLKKILIYIIFYILISALIIYFNLNRRYLIFNAGLSLIAYISSGFATVKKHFLLTFIATFITVIFFPNTLYMFTDYIHIKTSEYYTMSSGAAVYNMDYIYWIKLVVDVGMITLSMVLSYETFINILKTIKCYGYKIASFFILIFMSAISGFAIYVGRFLRLNSWDIFILPSMLRSIIAGFNTNDYYLIGTFALFQFFIILLFSNLKSD
ncbi:putative membrane protein [Peptoniphilus sp. ING2-D1G]|nr:putative membrane protein [Peptoniphilus sp. ING2-D1G]